MSLAIRKYHEFITIFEIPTHAHRTLIHSGYCVCALVAIAVFFYFPLAFIKNAFTVLHLHTHAYTSNHNNDNDKILIDQLIMFII